MSKTKEAMIHHWEITRKWNGMWRPSPTVEQSNLAECEFDTPTVDLSIEINSGPKAPQTWNHELPSSTVSSSGLEADRVSPQPSIEQASASSECSA